MIFRLSAFARALVNNDGSTQDGSAMLDVDSTSKGLLITG
jgi:hypothetical protein